MKLGADQKGKIAALVALAVFGAVSYFWGNGSGFTPSAVFGGGSARLPDISRLDPTLHTAALEQLRSVEYKGGTRDLFHFGPPPAPPAPLKPPTLTVTGGAKRGGVEGALAHPAAPAGPPPPPPIPLKFYGFTTPSAGGQTRVFLQMGDKRYIVSQGELVESRYQIVQINRLSVRVKDQQTQQEQDLPLISNQS